jgi:Arc/MetJ-type ribon-helix-helix transcriptional regulator
MKTNQYNIRIDPAIIRAADKVVRGSRGVYRNRSHFIEMALKEKIDRATIHPERRKASEQKVPA